MKIKGKQIWELPYYYNDYDEDNDSSDDEDSEEEAKIVEVNGEKR